MNCWSPREICLSAAIVEEGPLPIHLGRGRSRLSGNMLSLPFWWRGVTGDGASSSISPSDITLYIASMLIPVLLSGGVGSRLWPVSRAGRPKQFLPLGGEGSMLQETQRRTEGLACGPAIVVCNAEHRFMVAEQLRGETAESPTIMLEPAGRNTAPAIALAALQAQSRHPEALLLVLPADHHVTDPAAFRATVE